MKTIFYLWLLAIGVVFAEQNNSQKVIPTVENNLSSINATQLQSQLLNKLEQLKKEIEAIDKEILEKSVLTQIYNNYTMYQELQKKLEENKIRMRTLQKHKAVSIRNKEEIESLAQEQAIVEGKLALLAEYEKEPFKKFLEPPKIEEIPTVDNPLAIIGAISYHEKLISDQEEYTGRYYTLKEVIKQLSQKESLTEEAQSLSLENKIFDTKLKQIRDEIKTFHSLMDIFQTTQDVYTKKAEEIKLQITKDITKESKKTISIGGFLLFLLIMLLLVKYLVKRYMSEMDRYYTVNKALNLTFFIFVVLTLLFSYIQNVSYLVTILGFASAGIAIALKDWFMSVMGWFVIVIGGAIHVGDRVKFVRNGIELVGDVVDISLLRMTLHEDVTYISLKANRRAGRIIFVPNNFIFTDIIANYSHAGLKTVWDGIDFVVTFDSDFKKASSIAKEIAKKYSKGYTDITRKQLNKLRSQYHMKNTNVEPRIFTFIEPNGVQITVWYLTNSFATLTLRSTISAEIITRIQQEEDIFLAYPTQSVYMDKDARKPKKSEPKNIDIQEELPEK